VVALIGGFLWLGWATASLANPIAVYLTTTIYWATDFPFAQSTLSGVSVVFTDARGEISATPVDNLDPVAGPTDIPTTPIPLWINPGETILWSFIASLSSGDSTFPVCANGDFALPGGPCPIIPIATLTSDDFGSFSVTGAVFADTVQIGTWEIHSHEHLIAEPATVSLLGLGIAGLGLLRRRRSN
jgi:hypothetical protein